MVNLDDSLTILQKAEQLLENMTPDVVTYANLMASSELWARPGRLWLVDVILKPESFEW